MFTGIITDVGTVRSVEEHGAVRRLAIDTAYAADSIPIGASIAHAGVCLTVTTVGQGNAGQTRFTVDASPETLERTTMGGWHPGTRVNLERPLRIGDELGGHIVSGHVDGLATIVSRDDDGETSRFVFRAPWALAKYIAEKGSVTLDGTSLTVNGVEGDTFTVTLIPHTLSVTTWGDAHTGDAVNLEVDTMARYAARLAEAAAAGY